MVEIKKHASKQKFNLKQNSVTFLSPNEEIYTEEIDKKSKNKNKGTTFEDALKKEIASSIKHLRSSSLRTITSNNGNNPQDDTLVQDQSLTNLISHSIESISSITVIRNEKNSKQKPEMRPKRVRSYSSARNKHNKSKYFRNRSFSSQGNQKVEAKKELNEARNDSDQSISSQNFLEEAVKESGSKRLNQIEDRVFKWYKPNKSPHVKANGGANQIRGKSTDWNSAKNVSTVPVSVYKKGHNGLKICTVQSYEEVNLLGKYILKIDSSSFLVNEKIM